MRKLIFGYRFSYFDLLGLSIASAAWRDGWYFTSLLIAFVFITIGLRVHPSGARCRD